MLLFDEKVYSWNIFQMCGGVNNILFLWLYVELVWIKKIVTLKLPVVTYVTGIFKKKLNNQIMFLSFGGGFWLADRQSQPIRSLQLFIIKKHAKKGKNYKSSHSTNLEKKCKMFYFSIKKSFLFSETDSVFGCFFICCSWPVFYLRLTHVIMSGPFVPNSLYTQTSI